MLQAGANQNGDSRREWANAVLEALRSQNKLPGQPSLPGPGQGAPHHHQHQQAQPSNVTASDTGPAASSGAGPSNNSSGGRPQGGISPTGLSPSFAQLFPSQAGGPVVDGGHGGKGAGSHQSSIYHSPFAAHPRSNPAQGGSGGKGGASAMPAVPTAKLENQAGPIQQVTCPQTRYPCTMLPLQRAHLTSIGAEASHGCCNALHRLACAAPLMVQHHRWGQKKSCALPLRPHAADVSRA
jgi:hypothetical protein